MDLNSPEIKARQRARVGVWEFVVLRRDEIEEADFKWWADMTPAARVQCVLNMVAQWQRNAGNSLRVQRVYRVTKRPRR